MLTNKLKSVQVFNQEEVTQVSGACTSSRTERKIKLAMMTSKDRKVKKQVIINELIVS